MIAKHTIVECRSLDRNVVGSAARVPTTVISVKLPPLLYIHTSINIFVIPFAPSFHLSNLHQSMSRTALVTGANKGIGIAIVRNLALQYPSSTFNNGPLLIYLTARDQRRGEAALESLQGDAQLKKAKALASEGGLSTIKYHRLDISKPESIEDVGAFLKKEHPDGLDFVVNNAGIAMDGFGTYNHHPNFRALLMESSDGNVVKTTLQCNYYGTLNATRTFLPLVRPGGRLVNVASILGQLSSKYSPDLISRFSTSKSVDDVTKLMEAFTSAVEEGRQGEKGWPSAAYAVSKTGVIGMTRAIAREEDGRGRGVLVNSCCPGFVNTEMTKGRGTKSVDEGAQTPVMLALGDLGGKSAEFWQREKVIEW